MDTPIIVIGLPLALAIIMFGLGLSLTVADFVRVARWPKATLLALACQMFLLPVVCLGLVLLFDLHPMMAVGMMLLAASPGGTTANLFSHLAGGDVALNITLTAINSVLAIVTIPIVVNLSVQGFLGTETDLALPAGEVLQVVAIILIPVAIGMLVRRLAPGFAARMDKPVKIGSALVLAAVIVVALTANWAIFVDNVGTITPVAVLLCVFSLTIGYWVPKIAGVDRRQSIASGMEVGVHNATLAITIAITIMGNETLAIGPAVYGILMFVPAGVAAVIFAKRGSHAKDEALPAT